MTGLRKALLLVLLAGLVVFFYWFTQTGLRHDGPVVVTDALQSELAQSFRRLSQRAPTRAELDALIEDHVRQELAYREAQRRGLVADDPAVKQRMREKLESMLDDAASGPPSDAQLQAFLDANAADYRAPDVLSFRQLFFSTDAGVAAAQQAATRALAELRAPTGMSAVAQAGDPSALPPVSTNISELDIAARFGRDFAAALRELEPGVWSGPIPSVHGLHVVRVETRFAGGASALADVRATVARDWRVAQRTRARSEFYAQLRARYDVVIEPLQRPLDVLLQP